MKNLITKALGIAGITALSFLPMNGKGQDIIYSQPISDASKIDSSNLLARNDIKNYLLDVLSDDLIKTQFCINDYLDEIISYRKTHQEHCGKDNCIEKADSIEKICNIVKENYNLKKEKFLTLFPEFSP